MIKYYFFFLLFIKAVRKDHFVIARAIEVPLLKKDNDCPSVYRPITTMFFNLNASVWTCFTYIPDLWKNAIPHLNPIQDCECYLCVQYVFERYALFRMQKVVCKKWCFVMCTKMSILYETGILENVSYTAKCFARKYFIFRLI